MAQASVEVVEGAAGVAAHHDSANGSGSNALRERCITAPAVERVTRVRAVEEDGSIAALCAVEDGARAWVGLRDYPQPVMLRDRGLRAASQTCVTLGVPLA